MSNCTFHFKDTRIDDEHESLEIHTLCVSQVNDPDHFAMFDVIVGRNWEWLPGSVMQTTGEWIPKLRALGFKGLVDIGGISFPKTRVRI